MTENIRCWFCLLMFQMCVFHPDFLEHDDLSCNGLAVTPDHIDDDDDRSSHASSSDWAPQPQIGNLHNLHHVYRIYGLTA